MLISKRRQLKGEDGCVIRFNDEFKRGIRRSRPNKNSGGNSTTGSKSWRRVERWASARSSTGVGKKGGAPYRLEELGTDEGLQTNPRGVHLAVTGFFAK